MKNVLFTLFALGLLCARPSAQTPDKFNYQAVARETNGTPITTLIDVRFTILDGSAGGTEVYQEQHLGITPNNEGLFALRIGAGTVAGGAWSGINWGAGAKYLKVEIKKGTGVYVQMGTPQELVSVPYAMEAKGLDLPFYAAPTPGVAGPLFEITNPSGTGIIGITNANVPGTMGVFGATSGIGWGLHGHSSTPAGTGLHASNVSGTSADLATPANAGEFNGNVFVNGALISQDNNSSFGVFNYGGADANVGVELRSNGGVSFIDFSNDLGADYDARIIFVDNQLTFHAPAHRFSSAIVGESSNSNVIQGTLSGNGGEAAIAGISVSPNGNGVWGGHLVNGNYDWGGILGHKDYSGYFWGKEVLVDGKVRINGWTEQTLGAYASYKVGFNGLGFPIAETGSSVAVTEKYSLYATENIAAKGFYAHSDCRIKDVVGISDSRHDLDILNQIQITDYFFKDRVSQGDRPQKKVIGQQVAEVYPQAVTTNHREVVPDVMQMASIAQGWVSLPGHTLQTGDKVRLIFEQGKEELEVTESTAAGFRVAMDKTGDVFVYGREVSDFHIVDYEAIAMLNVSATQELSRQVQTLQAENAALQQQNEQLRQQFDRLSSRVDQLDARIGNGLGQR